MDGAVVSRRMVARTARWGFDALGMFFSVHVDKGSVEIAASTWSEEFCRREGGFAITSCPAAPEEGQPCG